MILADIDGVFVSLSGKPNTAALQLAAQYARRQPVAFLTGRERAALEEIFLPAWERAWESSTPPHELCVGAEYGAILLTPTPENIWQEELTLDTVPAAAARAAVQEVAQRYPKLVFRKRKRIVLTVAIPSVPDWDTPERRAQLAAADPELQEIAQRFGLTIQYSTKAIDLLPPGLDKTYGAEVILSRLRHTPEHVHIFGDAPADKLMTVACERRGLPFSYYHVDSDEETAEILRGLG
ncbi:MAG TPA: hypothetical protein VJC05_00865 [Candidatus Andersenbacteria bacterium]|nr:hypothetical protein [Candidatus Andersenbacteria bacterium]